MNHKTINVVLIGGGTGLSVLARGLKNYPIDISAVVTVADDGGSTGKIRSEIDMPAPGDIRNVLAALSESEALIKDLFTYRFNREKISGHSLGNLMLAAMYDMQGDFSVAVEKLSEILNVKGKVIPSTNRSPKLVAIMTDGTKYEGESYIPKVKKKIDHIYLSPSGIEGSNTAIEAIQNADFIIYGPGSLYTSIIPNVLPTSIKKALQESHANQIYISNIVEQPGETKSMTAADCVDAIHKHIGKDVITHVLASDEDTKQLLSQRYKEEGVSAVLVSKDELQKRGINVYIYDNIVQKTEEGILRHDSKQLAKNIYELVLELFETIEY